MSRLLAAWDRFFFAPRTARAAGLCRIAIGVVTLYSYALIAKDARLFLSDEGVLTAETLRRAAGRPVMSLLLVDGSPWLVALVFAGLFLAGAAFTLGYRTRLSGVLLFLLVLSVQERNPYLVNGADAVVRLALFWLVLTPGGGGAALSLDALRRRRRGEAPIVAPPWAQRMLQLQVVVIYLGTVAWKLRHPEWLTGEAMHYVFGWVDLQLEGIEQLLNLPLLTRFLNWSVLAAELFVPLGLLARKTRPWAILVGALLHGWVMVAMSVPVFGPAMLACYLAFLSEEEAERLLAWLGALRGGG